MAGLSDLLSPPLRTRSVITIMRRSSRPKAARSNRFFLNLELPVGRTGFMMENGKGTRARGVADLLV